MREQSTRLGTESIPKLLLNLSLPAAAGMFVSSLYNVVDTIFIARGVGTEGIAGLSIAFPIQMMIVAFAATFGIGGASIISRRLGAGSLEEANRVFGHIVWLIVWFSLLVVGMALFFLDPLLQAFGATADILPYARDYLLTILCGSVFFSFAMGTNNVVRSEGNAKTAMNTMMVSAIINTILDPIFIFGLDMGIQGAALATVIAQFCAAVWLLRYFTSGKSSLRLTWIGWKPDLNVVKEIIAIGISTFVRQVSFSLMFVVVNWMLVIYGGSLQVAIFGIINRLIAFSVMPMFGIVQGMQPIIGYNYGAGRPERVSDTVKLGIRVSSVIAVTIWVLVMLFPEFLFSIFTADQQVISGGTDALRWIFLMVPFVGFQMVTGGFYQALGKAKISFVLSLARQILFLIPILLILPQFLGLTGIWVAFPSADLLAFLLSLVIFFKDGREMMGMGRTAKTQLHV
ncbi:MATE family efflux transporter [Brevibacillus humidisoli]|uniref:MATE family efflux transporter n=1 Tax=Brevibacillus humidisoli TaxID=2895522 RepID=UPI001E42EE95|nr:MATE family efflux transporter [Brevibacillus humidisoli]UFJ39893.1 MATE family efflux transporter [Brevibacillus humidisoli]